MSFSDIIIFLLEHPVSRRFLRFLQRIFSPKKEIPVVLHNQIIYARSFDRIVSLYLRKFSLSESSETELFKSMVKEGMRIVDVGANLGYYTLIAATLVGKTGKVFAFEPDPESFSLLVKNIEANGYKNIEALNLAVSDRVGKIKLFLSEEHRGDHRIYDFGNDRKTVEVDAITLDESFKNNLSPIDLIKIDVEGAESLVFSGMKRIVKANQKLLIITEFWPRALKMCGSSPENFLKMVKEWGFLVYLIDENQKKLASIIDDATLLQRCGNRGYINLLLKR